MAPTHSGGHLAGGDGLESKSVVTNTERRLAPRVLPWVGALLGVLWIIALGGRRALDPTYLE